MAAVAGILIPSALTKMGALAVPGGCMGEAGGGGRRGHALHVCCGEATGTRPPGTRPPLSEWYEAGAKYYENNSSAIPFWSLMAIQFLLVGRWRGAQPPSPRAAAPLAPPPL